VKGHRNDADAHSLATRGRPKPAAQGAIKRDVVLYDQIILEETPGAGADVVLDVVDSVLSLEDVALIHRLEAGGAKGKIVLNVGS
jgi:hypothetical protein